MKHFPTNTPPRSVLRHRAAFTVVCASALLSTSAAALTTLQAQNLVPAFYSFDSAVALLGLRYGVDPASPVLASVGNVTDAGFSWSTAGNYLGSPVHWTVNGTFDPGTSTLGWTGSGDYGGIPWAMDGTTRWTSPTSFGIRDSLSIGGVQTLYSGTFENPDFNPGTFGFADGVVNIQELATRHWYSFLFGSTTDGWVVSTLQNGVIAVNVYTLTEDASKAGVKVEGGTPGGTIEIGGTRYVKLGFVSNVPEPSTWMLMVSSLGLLGLFRNRGRRGTASA